MLLILQKIYENKLLLNVFKNRIVNNITESEFKSLNNGELDLIFKDIDPRISSFQNFLEYLYSDELKDYQLLWELFTKQTIGYLI